MCHSMTRAVQAKKLELKAQSAWDKATVDSSKVAEELRLMRTSSESLVDKAARLADLETAMATQRAELQQQQQRDAAERSADTAEVRCLLVFGSHPPTVLTQQLCGGSELLNSCGCMRSAVCARVALPFVAQVAVLVWTRGAYVEPHQPGRALLCFLG